LPGIFGSGEGNLIVIWALEAVYSLIILDGVSQGLFQDFDLLVFGVNFFFCRFQRILQV
jgi:hypothetical protein